MFFVADALTQSHGVDAVRLEIRDVSWSVERARVLIDASLACDPGTMVALVGPNGSGKSSLLRCVYRVVRPDSGVVSVDGRGVWNRAAIDVAREMGVVLQERLSETAFTVREMVLMGRGPHKRLLERDTSQDRQIVASALARVGISSLADRAFDTLSGGEKQRVMIARALAQTPRLFVLDEPTTHLDIGHQHETLGMMRGLGITTIAALHDLNLAAAYCDQIFVLKAGSIRAHGVPSVVLSAALIEEVYGVKAAIGRHPLTGRPHVFVHGVGSASV
jgi:iron complex transport system ATP-binding protein